MPAPNQNDIRQGVPAGADIVDRQVAPGGGWYLLDSQGGVYGIDGANAHSSYWSLAPEQRQGTRTFKKLMVNPDGSYRLISNNDENYDFGNPHPYKAAPRALEEDPAWLAFLRSSGLTIDNATSAAAKKVGALSSSLLLDKDKLSEQNQRQIQSLSGDMEQRGLSRSGQASTAYNRGQSDYLRNVGDLERGVAQQIGDTETGLADTIAAEQRRGGETAATTETGYSQEALDRELGRLSSQGSSDYQRKKSENLKWLTA